MQRGRRGAASCEAVAVSPAGRRPSRQKNPSPTGASPVRVCPTLLQPHCSWSPATRHPVAVAVTGSYRERCVNGITPSGTGFVPSGWFPEMIDSCSRALGWFLLTARSLSHHHPLKTRGLFAVFEMAPRAALHIHAQLLREHPFPFLWDECPGAQLHGRSAVACFVF